MARGLNSLQLIGTATQTPELRYTQGGLAILEINLGGNDNVIGDDGQARDLAWYHRVTVFGNAAESLANQIEAGTPAFVDGAIEYRKWDDGGKTKSAVNIKGLRVEVLTFGTRKGETTVVDARNQHRIKDALNDIRLIGNLTRDAELRYTPSGNAVTRFSIAVNERYRDRQGQDQEKTHYMDVQAGRDLAEGTAELAKGDPVFVVGRLVNDAWTDAEGEKRYATRVEASRVEVLTRPNSPEQAATPSAAPQRAKGHREVVAALDIDEDEFPPEADLPF